MIVDTSALLAIVLDEPDAPRLLDAVLSAQRPRLSLASWFEAAMVIEAKGGRLASLRFDEFVRTAAFELEPVTLEQAQAARMAWRHFGLHKHTARLNFGDCFAYALAKTRGEPLLFEGDAFGRTDIEPALPSPDAAAARDGAAGGG